MFPAPKLNELVAMSSSKPSLSPSQAKLSKKLSCSASERSSGRRKSNSRAAVNGGSNLKFVVLGFLEEEVTVWQLGFQYSTTA